MFLYEIREYGHEFYILFLNAFIVYISFYQVITLLYHTFRLQIYEKNLFLTMKYRNFSVKFSLYPKFLRKIILKFNYSNLNS